MRVLDEKAFLDVAHGVKEPQERLAAMFEWGTWV